MKEVIKNISFVEKGKFPKKELVEIMKQDNKYFVSSIQKVSHQYLQINMYEECMLRNSHMYVIESSYSTVI